MIVNFYLLLILFEKIEWIFIFKSYVNVNISLDL